jgi:DNA polymerase (family X)
MVSTNPKFPHNQALAEIFRQMSACYRYLGPQERFRAAAYDQVAKTLSNMQEPIDSHADKLDELEELKGVGESIGEKIQEYLKTGKIQTFETLKKTVPSGLLELMEISGLGPSTVKKLHDDLHIESKKELIDAIREGRLRGLEGFGQKKIDNIGRALNLFKEQANQRMPLAYASRIANRILADVIKTPGVKQAEIAGSIRRKKETIGDIDILIMADPKNRSTIVDSLVHMAFVDRVLARGDTKLSILLKENQIQVDFRLVTKEQFGGALFYFTGSKEHNIALRLMAKKKGWKLNEYGVFDQKTGDQLAGKSEKEIYQLFGFNFIPPEQRLGKKEFEDASKTRSR